MDVRQMQGFGTRFSRTRGLWLSAVGIAVCIIGVLACAACGEQSAERQPGRSTDTASADPIADQPGDNLLTNSTLDFDNAAPDADAIVEGWRFYAGEPDLLEQSDAGDVVLKSGGSTRALYQDIALTAADDDDAATPSDSLGYAFTCRFRAEPGPANGTLAYLSVHDTQGNGSRRSPNLVADGDWHTLRIAGAIPSTGRIRAHIWITAGAAEIKDPAVRLVPIESALAGPRSSHDATADGVELVRWDRWDGRLSLQSTITDISLTFGRDDLREGGFLMNVMSADHENLADYMCLPDDLIVVSEAEPSSDAPGASLVAAARSHALEWDAAYTPESGRAAAETGSVEFRRLAGDGWNPAPAMDRQPWSEYTPPPLDIRILHEMGDDERWVPMTVTATNRANRPLRVTYLIQDGAWMTDFRAGHQENVHQHWPDGAYTDERAVWWDDAQIAARDAWSCVYNDTDGGMSSTLYAPPDAPGSVLWMAMWDGESGGIYIDAKPGNPEGWHTPEGMLSVIGLSDEPDREPEPYDSRKLRIRGALLDLGVIQPGDTASAVIVKIFDTGYADRADMVRRIESIIDGIPPYTEHWLHRPE